MSDDLNPITPANPGETVDDLARALDDLRAAAMGGLSDVGQSLSSTRSSAGDCPELGSWFLLATGETSAAEKDALLLHASLCASCLARLRACQRSLASDASASEAEELRNFAPLTPQWQHHLAVKLARTPHGANRKAFLAVFTWTALATAALLAIAISAGIWWRRQHAPEKLLAEAYSDARTFELRVPGAGFAPVTNDTHLRGGSAGRESAPLLSARAQIESKLEKNPNDPHWLQLQARALILEENYDAAIDILDRLIAAGPVTPALLTDGASAYFLRGTATGSENDRATALDYLRRADEMAPTDPVVLFNEALVMQDRGQMMNAVETWNRFIKFEHDPKWLEEGNRRLSALEDKLNRLKTHESRMERHLATPQAIRALAADPATLASIDEELSTSLLPRLLNAAYPLPVDRSRGSPCDQKCLAARSLLHALASSLETHHQDPWLIRVLPSDSSLADSRFAEGAHALAVSIDDNVRSDYLGALRASVESRDLFEKIGNRPGASRAEVERIYALERTGAFTACHEAIAALLRQAYAYPWIAGEAMTVDGSCNMAKGTAATDNPVFRDAIRCATDHHYTLLELRARGLFAALAVLSGDTETAWRADIQTLQTFYKGDHPPFRAGTVMAALAWLEQRTPRTRLDLLLNREAVALFTLAPNAAILQEQRNALVRAAIRAGALEEAHQQMAILQKEKNFVPSVRIENEILMADLDIERGDPSSAARLLDAAGVEVAHQDNPYYSLIYATARGELDLVLNRPGEAEHLLRSAIVEAELEASGAGRSNIIFARDNRDLYAAMAAALFAEHRPGVEILALWERYRLRILGEPVPACRAQRLDCLTPQLKAALQKALPSGSGNLLVGQIALRDHVLLYRSDGVNVTWSRFPLQRSELLAASAALTRVTGSPATSQASVDQAARKLGNILLMNLPRSSRAESTLLLEADPLLGNVPWAAVETESGPIGLHFNLEEAPTILQASRPASAPVEGRPLVVGASATSAHELLPEVLQEARSVARMEPDADALLARDATEANVAAHLGSAPLIHFAGHATEYDGATRLLLASGSNADTAAYLDRSLLLKDPPRAARLVVFSACSTGKREEGWDHGMGDIVDTLASLGVPEVVATRWQIDSASAVPMMTAFYQGLAGGLRVPQALTAARLSLVRDARYSHPYYWAAYYASGVGDTDLREVFHGQGGKEAGKGPETR